MSTATPTRPTDRELYEAAEQLLDALLSSASVDKIGRTRWWDRAKTALETGAASSTNFYQAAAKTAAKLQIDTLNEHAAGTVVQLKDMLHDPATFARWRTLCMRDALVIAANVRIHRVHRRTEQEETK